MISAPSSAPLHSIFYSKTSKSKLKSEPTNQCKRHPFHTTGVHVNGKLATAHQVFDEIPLIDTFSWNNLIQTHLAHNDPNQALLTYGHMLVLGVRPDRHTIPRILTASRISRSLIFGKQVHGQALKLGLSYDSYVFTALLELYGQLDSADTARWLFDKSCCDLRRSTIAWTMLAKLYVSETKPRVAIDLFNLMTESRAADVDSVALATVIGASGQLKSLKDGKNAHRIAKEQGLEDDVLVSNLLLKMYLDCGCLENARQVFDRMSFKDAISYTEMLRGYVKKGGFNEGLKLFRKMILSEGIRPDPLSISSILPACARVTAYKNGREIHSYLLRNGIELNLTLLNALLDMYAKSGNIEYVSKIFSRMKEKDAISWTVMLMGYSLHGYGDVGVQMFLEMEKRTSVQTDQTLYTALLYACCTAHLVDDGMFFFNKIQTRKVADYALIVALLARSGLFKEARAFVEKRKLSREKEILRALLDGYRIRKNINEGKRITEQLLDLEPLNAENYVLLSNWYAHQSKWDMVDKMKETIKDMGLKPRKAYSWIEFRNKVHVFGTGDVSHPRSEKIYWQLQRLMEKLDEQELTPCTNFSLHDVDEERECIPIGHSELLAVSFGFISTQAGTTIRVTKNSRLCHSCHDSIRLISRVVDRQIIVKDVTCFHHFKDGLCSCREF